MGHFPQDRENEEGTREKNSGLFGNFSIFVTRRALFKQNYGHKTNAIQFFDDFADCVCDLVHIQSVREKGDRKVCPENKHPSYRDSC